jgi:hypothetical protein
MILGMMGKPPSAEGPELASFASAQLRKIGRLVDLARELTGEFFQLAQDEAHRLPYEVRTLSHLKDQEVRHDGILADLARYQYQEPLRGRKKDLYRVNLQDHNILQALEREGGRLGFSPLLLYVLTHEVVHVIRFVKFLAPFHKDPATREDEERLVHEVTQRILAKVPIEGLGEVLDRYEHLSLDRTDR